MSDKSSLKVLYVASEVSPYAKTGGLADVAGSLPRELAVMGHDVRIAMPRYKVIEAAMETIVDFPVQMGTRRETAIIRKTHLEGSAEGGSNPVTVYFVDNYHYFDRENIYVYFDEAERFAFYCRAILEMLPRIDFRPDVIHCNDWQSGPLCLLLKEEYSQQDFYREMATLYTVHNLHYQGNYPKNTLQVLGLSDYYYHPERIEFYGNVSFVKSGLVYADIINTVSETYAEEIKTPEFGEGMEGLLKQREKDLFGIVNGINTYEFDPEKDPYIFVNYGAHSPEKKRDNKAALQKEIGLPVKDVPLIGLVHRLVDQKGLDLLADVFDDLMELDVQFVLLGQGDRHYEEFFSDMQDKYPERMTARIGFSAALAQQIYAGSDIFLMPSRFEPCGLGQLIALRYGTLPVVRSTGGLADTITEYNPVTGEGNGFVFSDYKSKGFWDALLRGIQLFNEDKDNWSALVKKSLEMDFSWAKSAKKYVELYRKSLSKRT